MLILLGVIFLAGLLGLAWLQMRPLRVVLDWRAEDFALPVGLDGEARP